MQALVRTACLAAVLVMLAGAAPHAFGEPGGLCGRSLYAGDIEYEPVDVSYGITDNPALTQLLVDRGYEPVDVSGGITDGNFLGLCANQEYGVFDLFVDSGSGEKLVLTIPKEEFDPRQFDYPTCDFGYGSNGKGSKNEGIRAEQIYSTDQHRTIRFSWDAPVSQISYLKSPNICMEKEDAEIHARDQHAFAYKFARSQGYDHWESVRYAETFYVGSSYFWMPDEAWQYSANRDLAVLDARCASPSAHIIYLNHTISGGRLDRICSVDEDLILFDISPEAPGELIVDIPNDVFPQYYGGHPEDDLPCDPSWDICKEGNNIYPFSITMWNRHGVPYNSAAFYHADGISRVGECVILEIGCHPDRRPEFYRTDGIVRLDGCIIVRNPCFPIPFFGSFPVTKISSHPAFDRYSIPFKTDDAKIVLRELYGVRLAIYPHYHPEKYEVMDADPLFRDLR